MTYKRRRIATLDLGTNSLLLLVAERDESGRLTVLADESCMPRPGQGMRAEGRIAPPAFDRTVQAVADFAARARELGAEEIVLTATSATREARNQSEFVAAVREASGLKAVILPPSEEVRLTYVSCTAELRNDSPTLVVDIGGGSTEISWGLGPRFDGGRSLDLGTVKLQEGCLPGDPPSAAALEAARKEIGERLSRLTPLGGFERYIGTAGSFTHLAGVDLGLADYHSERVSGYKLTAERVAYWISRLCRLTVKERCAIPGMDPRRADVILAGSLIVEGLFRKLGTDHFQVFDRGIRFGTLFDRLRNFEPPVIFG